MAPTRIFPAWAALKEHQAFAWGRFFCMTPLPLSGLSIHRQACFSLVPNSEESLVAALRQAWASDANGAIAKAEQKLLEHHSSLYMEYLDLMASNPRAPRGLKAEFWCRQKLEGALSTEPFLFRGEPVTVVFKQAPCLSKKRHRPIEPPVVERTAKAFEFKRPRSVQRASPEGRMSADSLARQRSDAQTFMRLHRIVARSLEELRRAALMVCQRLMDRFREG